MFAQIFVSVAYLLVFRELNHQAIALIREIGQLLTEIDQSIGNLGF